MSSSPEASMETAKPIFAEFYNENQYFAAIFKGRGHLQVTVP